MAKINYYVLLLGLIVLLTPASVRAQQFSASEGEPAPYQAERALIESTLETVVAIIQEVVFEQDGSALGDRMRQITDQLTQASTLMPTKSARSPRAMSEDDLEDLRFLLQDISRQLGALRDELEEEEEYDLADRLAPIHRDIRDANRIVGRLAEKSDEPEQGNVTVEDGAQWLRPGRYGDDESDRTREDRDEDIDRRDRDEDASVVINDGRTTTVYTGKSSKRNRNRDDGRWRSSPFGWGGYAGTYIGEFSYRWPYRRETALYRTVPAVRYNRVEGFVLGFARRPMNWDDWGRARIYGDVGYAFSAKEWRYTAGLEVRLDNMRSDDFGLKIGGAYRYNTETNDRWKTSWLENSLAAFFFNHDFFDYYQVQGGHVYAVQRLTPFSQLSIGYRVEDHTSMPRATSWSLFRKGHFAPNPEIQVGRMQTVLIALEGGHVRSLHYLPRGGAFRLEAEIGEGVGGDFSFNRYIFDGRQYIRTSRHSSLGLRLRGGYATSGVPIQKLFTLGGVGSLRAYPQNGIPGSRMLLGNIEYIYEDLSQLLGWLDDFHLLGFFDAGWTNATSNAFDFNDVLPSAGFGVGVNRNVRLELAWPLKDYLGNGHSPSLWLRITPTF